MLKLHVDHIQLIRTHAESTYPQECCGIMLGEITDDSKALVEVWQTENVWSAEADRYLDGVGTTSSQYAIAPAVLMQAQRQARDHHLEIIGIYHSHPDHPAVPSEFDRVYAWQQYSYIIVSVQKGKVGDLLCWSLDECHQFQSEEIVTVQSEV